MEASLLNAERSWEALALDARRPELDAQSLRVGEFHEASAETRERLRSVVREMKETPPAERPARIGALIKAFQAAVDELTQRASFAEASFLGIFKLLDGAPDPTRGLRAAREATAALARALAENGALLERAELAERQLAGMRAELGAQEAERQRHRDERSKLDEEVRSARAALEGGSAELRAMCEEAQSRAASLQAKADDQAGALEAARTEMGAASAARDEARAAAAAAARAAENAQAVAAAATARAEGAERALAGQSAQLGTREDVLRGAQRREAELEAEAAELRARIGQLEGGEETRKRRFLIVAEQHEAALGSARAEASRADARALAAEASARQAEARSSTLAAELAALEEARAEHAAAPELARASAGLVAGEAAAADAAAEAAAKAGVSPQRASSFEAASACASSGDASSASPARAAPRTPAAASAPPRQSRKDARASAQPPGTPPDAVALRMPGTPLSGPTPGSVRRSRAAPPSKSRRALWLGALVYVLGLHALLYARNSACVAAKPQLHEHRRDLLDQPAPAAPHNVVASAPPDATTAEATTASTPPDAPVHPARR